MAILDTKLFEVIRPKSLTDPKFEETEFLLLWFGRPGGPDYFLFTDFRDSVKVKSEQVNIEEPNLIQSLPESEISTFRLTAENISKEDYDWIRTVYVSKDVRRLFRDGTSQRLAVLSANYRNRASKNRRVLEIEVIEAQKPLAL